MRVLSLVFYLKKFFLTKVGDKQLGLRSLASFTKLHIYFCGRKYGHTSVASHLMISSLPRSEQSQMRHVKEQEEQEQSPIFSCK